MIHYIVGYADEEHIASRKCSLAGVAKMNYIVLCLSEMSDCQYQVYSTCQVKGKEKKNTDRQVKYRASIPSKGRIGYYLDLLIAVVQLCWYLLLVPSDDIVMVYHERWYLPWVQVMHKIKRRKLIYEVEEIYLAVANHPQKEVDREIRNVKKADGYILSTAGLSTLLGLQNANNISVCNGVYMPVFKKGSCGFTDECTHLVYAGSLNKAKGADLAIKVMEKLPEHFVLHISGSGTQKDCDYIKSLIDEATRSENIIYEGCLSEDEHLSLLQKCDIGLCPANPTAAFPSKILEYMRNGLKVVSVCKPEIQSAQCAESLHFFSEDDMDDFACQIVEASKDNSDVSDSLEKMHTMFVDELEHIVRSL